MMAELNIKLTKEEQRMNVRPLIALICRRFFGDFNCIYLDCVMHLLALFHVYEFGKKRFWTFVRIFEVIEADS